MPLLFFPHSFFFTRSYPFLLVNEAPLSLFFPPCDASAAVPATPPASFSSMLLHRAAEAGRLPPRSRAPAAVPRRLRALPWPAVPRRGLTLPPPPRAPAAVSRSRPSPLRSRARAHARLPPPCTSVRASRGRLTVAHAARGGQTEEPREPVFSAPAPFFSSSQRDSRASPMEPVTFTLFGRMEPSKKRLILVPRSGGSGVRHDVRAKGFGSRNRDLAILDAKLVSNHDGDSC